MEPKTRWNAYSPLGRVGRGGEDLARVPLGTDLPRAKAGPASSGISTGASTARGPAKAGRSADLFIARGSQILPVIPDPTQAARSDGEPLAGLSIRRVPCFRRHSKSINTHPGDRSPGG